MFLHVNPVRIIVPWSKSGFIGTCVTLLSFVWEVSYRFVPVKCGSRRKAPTQSPPDDLKRTKTLDDFIPEKGKERHGFLKQKKI